MTITPGLWFLIGCGVAVACVVACDAIARSKPKAERKPCTLDDDRVAYLLVKQRAMGKRMRREGRSILSKTKIYTPAIGEAPSLKPHAKVYAIRGGKR